MAAAVALASGWVTGAQPAAASAEGLVINELYPGGGKPGATYFKDYVVLFNAGTSTVNLTGWSLRYAGAGTPGTGSLSGSVPPGGYVLVAEAPSAQDPVPLPPADATLVSNINSTGGTLYLQHDGAPVDVVGWGDGVEFEGAHAPAPGMDGNWQALRRAHDGCQDTDQNAADFAVGPPLPFNSSTVPLPCAVAPTSPTQTVSLDVRPVTGALSISLAQGSVDLGSLDPGTTTPVTPVGDISFSNTFAAASAWTTSVAATQLTDATFHTLPFTALTYAPGTSITPSTSAVGAPIPGASGHFAAADATSVFSAARTLASGTGSDRGDFTQSGSTLIASTPPGQPAGTYAGTLQYTITSAP